MVKSQSKLSWQTDQRTARVRHGKSNTAEYRIWEGMLKRCVSPSCNTYSNYGGRGITVCDRWRNSFLAFLDDLGLRPSLSHSIDRINGAKGYWCGQAVCTSCAPTGELSNCRWATPQEQHNNKCNNHWYEFRGQRLTAPMLARLFNLDRKVVAMRLLRGESTEQAISRPARQRC